MIKNAAIITILLVVLGLGMGSLWAGRSIYVDDGPADFNNIQAAIDDSNDGDTIIVADGTYTGLNNREIDFKGKAITVRSPNGHCSYLPGNKWILNDTRINKDIKLILGILEKIGKI